MTTNQRPLRIGIVGANWTLKAHAPAWRMLPGCEVIAVCTAHQETADAAAATCGIPRAYGDYRRMVDDPDIDVFVVGTQPKTRQSIVMAALEGGKHVYNCLPFALSAAAARELRDAQVSRGLVGVVDAQFRWVPALRYMKDLIAEGWLGDVFQATVELQTPLVADGAALFPSSADPGLMNPYLWLAKADSGASAWRNFGSHALLNLTWLFGDIDEVVGDAKVALSEWRLSSGDVVKPENPDIAMALVKFKNGVFANVNTGWSKADPMTYRLEVWGSKGRFLVEDTQFCDAPRASLYYGAASRREYGRLSGGLLDIPSRYFQVPGTPLKKEGCPAFIMPMAAIFADMARAIREGGEGSPNFSEAAHVHAAVEAMVSSTQTRRWTPVE